MHKPVSVKFDAEGWEYIIVFDWTETYIISGKGDGHTLITIEINRDDLAKDLVSDIHRDLGGWSSWVDYGGMTDDERNERSKDLLILCEMLERRIPSDDWKLVYARGDN